VELGLGQAGDEGVEVALHRQTMKRGRGSGKKYRESAVSVRKSSCSTIVPQEQIRYMLSNTIERRHYPG